MREKEIFQDKNNECSKRKGPSRRRECVDSEMVTGSRVWKKNEQ